MKEYLNFGTKRNFKTFAVMLITACHCDNEILKFLFFVLGYEGIDIYAYMMHKSNKNK